MAKPRQENTLIRQLFKDVVNKKVTREEFTKIVNEYMEDISRIYFNSNTKASNKVQEVTRELKDGVVYIKVGNQEVVSLALDEKILSGEIAEKSPTKIAESLIELTDDFTESITLSSMAINNTLDEESGNSGFSIVAEEKAPTMMESYNYSMGKIPGNIESAINIDESEWDIPTEYNNNLARRKALLSNFEAFLKVDTKSSKVLDPEMKAKLVTKYLINISEVKEKSYDFEEEIKREAIEEDSSYSVKEMVVLMNPDIVKKDNVLKNKFNEDGTLIEMDVLIQNREALFEMKANQIEDEEKLAKVKEDINNAYARLMYEKLLSDHSKAEVKDLRRRLGDDRFIEELENILKVEEKLRDENFELDSKLVRIIEENKDNLKESFIKDGKYVPGASDAMAQMLDLGEVTKEDIKIRDEEYIKMNSRLDFIREIRDQVIQTKGSLKPYTKEEQEKADEEKLLRRLNVVGLVGNAFMAIKNGTSKSIKDFFNKMREKQEQDKAKEKEYEKEIDLIDDDEIENTDSKENVNSEESEEDPKDEPKWKDPEPIIIQGPQGEPGKNGEKGEKGDTGEKGDKGEKGEQGEKGEPGEKGQDGKNGIDGNDGKDGVDGKNGIDGRDGKDAQPAGPINVNVNITEPKKETEEPKEPENVEEPKEKEISDDIQSNKQEDVKAEENVVDENNLEENNVQNDSKNNRVEHVVDKDKDLDFYITYSKEDNEKSTENESQNKEVVEEKIEEQNEQLSSKEMDSRSSLASTLTQVADAYKKAKIQKYDAIRVHEIDAAEKLVADELEKGLVSVAEAKEKLNNIIDRIDGEMGEKMDVIENEVGKVYSEALKLIDRNQTPKYDLNKALNHIKEKEREKEELAKKIDSDTAKKLDRVEAEREASEKGEINHGKDIS